MTIAPKKTVLADFHVEFIGVEYPDYFSGYGLGPNSKYSHCTYGIGNTKKEALEDCMEMMAQSGEFDWSEDTENRIRMAYGDCDDSTTVAEALGLDEEEDSDDCGESAWFYVGIKWNECISEAWWRGF